MRELVSQRKEEYMNQEKIIIRGLSQNNLKNVSLDIPKGKIVVFCKITYLIFNSPKKWTRF